MTSTKNNKEQRSKQAKRLLALIPGLVFLASCSSSDNFSLVKGEVLVDGAKADIGTIQFKPADDPGGRGEGAAIHEGDFEIINPESLKPGLYKVTALVSRKTGAVRKDPQRGEIEVLQQLELKDSPQEVELTAENADRLELSFATKSK